MGLIFGLIRRLIRLFIYLFILAAIVVFIPNLPPYTKFTSISLEPTLPSEGPLAPNSALNNAQKEYIDKLSAPEAFQLYKGELYTSLATGEIVKLSPGGHITFVTKIGEPCTGTLDDHICGRPLGFQIDETNNMLYVADAYYGIWRVNLASGKKQLLISPREKIEGKTPQLFNSLALATNGDFYWTDSSSDYPLKDGAFAGLSDPSGRLMYYNGNRNVSKVLLDDLWFPNGVVVSPDRQFVVVSETFRLRLIKYYIDGPKKGKQETLVAGLPGAPDNLRALPDGSGVAAALYSVFSSRDPLLTRSLAPAPLARKLLARLQRLIEIPFEFLHSIYPHVIFEEIVYNIGHFKSISSITPEVTGLLQIDWNGNIVASYFNTDKSMNHISDAIVFNNKLYTGTPHGQNYITSVPAPPRLAKAFQVTRDSHQTKPPAPKVEVKREAPNTQAPAHKQAKPVETAQKPTQQPPKTTTPAPRTTPPPKPESPKAQPKAVPTTTPKPAPKTTTPPAKPAEVKSTPKPEAKTTTATPVKTTTSKPTVKSTTTSKPEVKAKVEKATKQKQTQENPNAPKPEQIPIKEEIPSDTAKPTKETLKVIKKGGPVEIPNPNLI